MDSNTNNTERRATLWTLIKDTRFAMFMTRHNNGHFHARPMTTQNKDLNEDCLWFFMPKDGETVADLDGEAQVNVSYADTGDDSYVSVSGRASIVDDPAKAQALWSRMADAWFPGGSDDPNLALVKVQISHAHYWDVEESKIVQLYMMAKASVTGKPPTDLGDSVEVRMD